MKEQEIRRQIVETGRDLLESGLVARTWGNVSARLDEDNFLITPSGLDYTKMQNEDIVRMNLTTGAWDGTHKPSGEKGVHQAAYAVYDDVNFVIHTHQTYATAIGLAGFDTLAITDEERSRLGGIALAGYGLSGTAKLTNAVRDALQGGAKTVLMLHHGALICGNDRAETMEKALLLEEICRRSCLGQQGAAVSPQTEAAGRKLAQSLQTAYSYADVLQTPQTVRAAQSGKPLIAQLDDMAQMIGRKAPAAVVSKVKAAMKCRDAVLVPGIGIAVKAQNQDDLEALKLLMQKAAIAKLHTDALGSRIALGRTESALMHFVYRKKYAKQKEQKKG